MNRGWADAEMALHVGLGRRSSEHARVGVDEGQILTLLFGEALPTGIAWLEKAMTPKRILTG